MVGNPGGHVVDTSTDYAIVVGIDKYRPGILSLKGAVNDARLFAEWLARPDGGNVPAGRITTIVSPDTNEERPIKSELERALLELLNMRIASPDIVGRRLYLFFAGHGVGVPDYRDCALVTAESDAPSTNVHPIVNAVPGIAAANRLGDSPLFREIILIMDCCRELLDLFPQTLQLKSFGGRLPGFTYLHCFAADWRATTSEQLLPNPIDETRPPLIHGVFTHALIKGLKHGTDARTGLVTGVSLREFVKAKIAELVPGEGESVFEPTESTMLLGNGTLVDVVVTLSDPSCTLRVLNGIRMAPVELPPGQPSAGPFVLNLPFGRYRLQMLDTAGNERNAQTIAVLGERLDVTL